MTCGRLGEPLLMMGRWCWVEFLAYLLDYHNRRLELHVQYRLVLEYLAFVSYPCGEPEP